MLEVKILGKKYFRLILSKLDQNYLDQLKNQADYVYLVGYEKTDLPGFNRLDKKTSLIDLTLPLPEIFQNFNDTCRNEIKKTEKIEGLKFVELDKNFNAVYKLHKNFELAQGRTPLPKAEIKQSKIFSCYFNNLLIASIICYNHDGIIRTGQICSLRMDLKSKKLPPFLISAATRRLIYQIIVYGQKNGLIKLDLAVVNLTDPTKAGIAQFKQSFNGQLVETFIYRWQTKSFANFSKFLLKFKKNIH